MKSFRGLPPDRARVLAAVERLMADSDKLTLTQALELCAVAVNADPEDVLVVDVARHRSWLWRREGLAADSLSSGVLRLVDVSP